MILQNLSLPFTIFEYGRWHTQLCFCVIIWVYFIIYFYLTYPITFLEWYSRFMFLNYVVNRCLFKCSWMGNFEWLIRLNFSFLFHDIAKIIITYNTFELGKWHTQGYIGGFHFEWRCFKFCSFAFSCCCVVSVRCSNFYWLWCGSVMPPALPL